MAWSGSSLESSLGDASSQQLFSPLCRKTLLVSGLLPVSGGPRGGSAGTSVSFTALSILSMPHDSTEEVSSRPHFMHVDTSPDHCWVPRARAQL